MLKKISSIFVFVTIFGLLLSNIMVTTASAQDGALDPNTPVSNVDGVMPVSKTAKVSNEKPFTGTGTLPQDAEHRAANAGKTAPPAPSIYPESVIGPDGRTKVSPTTTYPSRAIAYLYITWADNTAGSCTGWFIGPRTLATAGHCVYNTAGGAGHGWAKNIYVYPGRNGASAPYGVTASHKLFAVTGWTTSGNPDYDYGAIQTNAPLGNTVGQFLLRTQVGNIFTGTFTVRGYPGDKPAGTMWTMNSNITHANAYHLWYNADTFGGQSGSPLAAPYNGVCCYAVGIHTYGTSLPPYAGNSATRINQAVFNNLTAWKAAAYP